MATATVEDQTHNPPNDKESVAQTGVKASATVHEDEKQLVASVRPAHENPFVVREHPEEKHLGLSARSLRLDNFELIKTLGTGKLRFQKNEAAYSGLMLRFNHRNLCPRVALSVKRCITRSEPSICPESTSQSRWYERSYCV
jgi:hypothetical protein